MCKKIVTNFYTLKNLILNSLIKKLVKYCYFDKNVKFFLQLFKKNQFIQKVKKILLSILNF